MSRHDIFLFAHKGLRAAMFAAGSALGRTAFEAPGAARGASLELRRVLGFLREHGEHEDRMILPAVGRHCPTLATGLMNEHGLAQGQEDQLLALLDRLDVAAPRELAAIGRRVRAQFHRVLAHHLAHMDREEEEANRVLHANFSDDELLDLHTAVLGSIPVARRAKWQALILPALSPDERAQLEHHVDAPPAPGGLA